MNKIHPLPAHIVAKIAAGEIIERPAFAVKELIENALDAHADSITVTIEDAGLKKIIVSDTGEGMTKDDLIESIKPHTTSKIFEDAEALTGISTLGFRGEALASIAAVSNLTIKSRPEETAIGNMISLLSGVMQTVTPTGMQVGTVVTIEQLFHALPARKQFLKSPETEFRHIVDSVISYALRSSVIAFRLIHNKKIIIDVPKKQTLTDRIIALLGKGFYASLLPVTYENSYISIRGFIGNPQTPAKTTGKQFFYVNGRHVTDAKLSQALKDSYGNLVDMHSYPLGIIYITLPYEFVDVNVHPRKSYVAFTDTSFVMRAICEAVKQTLSTHALSLSDSEKNITASYAGKLLRSGQLPGSILTTYESPIIQIHETYLILETKEGILLIDQHAAHERILYEHFKDQFVSHSHELYPLTNPYEFELSLSDAIILEEHLPLINTMGFLATKTGKTTFRLTRVPMLFQDRNYEEFLQEFCDTIRQEQNKKDIDILSQKMLSYLACRSAIKAGDILTTQQAKELLKTLEKTPHNTTCAHGRPVYQKITLEKLHTMFKRK